MITIPNQQSKSWRQANNSDLQGNLSVTKNITFDKEGYLQLSNRAVPVYDETSNEDFNNVASIAYNDAFGYVAQTWDEPWEIDSRILKEVPQIITSGANISGDIQSDLVWFDRKLVNTRASGVSYYDPFLSGSDKWVNTNINLTNTSQSQHPAVNFVSLSQLAIGDVFQVKLYSSPLTATPVLTTTLTISRDFQITGMCYFNQNLYIATMHRYGGHAYMFVWNGQGSAAQSAYEVDSNIIFSITAHRDSIVLLTGNGSLLRFNGSGFTMLDAFPIFYTDRALTDEANINLYKNVLKSNGDLLYILFHDENSKTITSQPQGIWCYDENVGLYHRYSLSNSTARFLNVTAASVNVTSDEITVTNAPPTGTELFFTSDTDNTLVPLVSDTKYYVINVASNKIKLATSRENAFDGVAIDLISTLGTLVSFTVFNQVDYGQFYTNRVMSLYVIERPLLNTQYGTDLLWGAELYNREDGSNDSYLGTVSDNLESRGYFITPKINSSNITDTFNKVTLKFSPMLSELDKIIIKYRVTDDRLEEVILNGGGWTANWTGVNTFTTTQTDFSRAKIGDEIEVLRGAAGGLLAHITNITVNSGTYTVTIDENFSAYTTGDESKIIFRNWKKWKTIEHGDTNALKGYISEAINATGKFIQMKIELRGLQVRVEELSIDNKYHLPSKQ